MMSDGEAGDMVDWDISARSLCRLFSLLHGNTCECESNDIFVARWSGGVQIGLAAGVTNGRFDDR